MLSDQAPPEETLMLVRDRAEAAGGTLQVSAEDGRRRVLVDLPVAP